MWNLRPNERLREWRNFRTQLNDLPFDEACTQTSHLWSYAPFVNYYLDPNKDHSLIKWPDPWTLLHENQYCNIAKGLGMLYTIYLCRHRSEDVELHIYQAPNVKSPCVLVWLADGKYILNFSFDEVVNKTQIDDSLQLQYRYTVEDLQINLY